MRNFARDIRHLWVAPSIYFKKIYKFRIINSSSFNEKNFVVLPEHNKVAYCKNREEERTLTPKKAGLGTCLSNHKGMLHQNVKPRHTEMKALNT